MNSDAAELRDRVERLLAQPGPLPIVTAGDPVLRQTAAPYDGQLDDDLWHALIDRMRLTMLGAPGVGLAAPQVGVGLALAVVEDPGAIDEDIARVRHRTPVAFRVLVNPAYAPVGSQRVGFYEGCLSVPGWQAVTPRWCTVRLTGLDEHGDAIDEVVEGWGARIVQHETDHLAGQLYLDSAHLRSLTSDRNAALWVIDPAPHIAAAVLGFPMG